MQRLGLWRTEHGESTPSGTSDLLVPKPALKTLVGSAKDFLSCAGVFSAYPSRGPTEIPGGQVNPEGFCPNTFHANRLSSPQAICSREFVAMFAGLLSHTVC